MVVGAGGFLGAAGVGEGGGTSSGTGPTTDVTKALPLGPLMISPMPFYFCFAMFASLKALIASLA